MADVDLLVQVRDAGIPGALTRLAELQKAASSSGEGLTQLGKATAQAMRAVTTSMSAAGASSKTYSQAITEQGSKATSLRQSLSQLNAEYRRLATIKPGATPLDRITAAGNGNVAAGMAVGRTTRDLQESFNANIVRDMIAVENEELAVQKARIAVLNAQQSVSKATSSAALANMTAQERAAQNLLTAERALDAAKFNSKATAGGTTSAELNAHADALKKEASATTEVSNAQRIMQKAISDASAAAERQTAILNAAKNNRANARTDVANAKWEQEAAGLTAQERATQQLARAEMQLVAANKAVEQSMINRDAKGKFTAQGEAQINGQTAALRGQANAIREVTAAQAALANAEKRSEDADNAFQSSYSYFIIAGMATKAASAIMGVGAAAIMASSQVERSFVDVERTFDGTSGQLDSLRASLTALSTTTPNSFVDLAQIAALGNQLGVAAGDIEQFTTTIAQYSAISGQTADDAATAFGKIGNLTHLAADQYSNLASSISYVARTSAATEATIQNTAKEITALASGAGFSAQGIVGLAGALSSLAIPPERARGSLSLYFGALNSAVSEGGPKLEAFARLTGRSAEEITNLVRANKGQDVFTSFISGLSRLDTVAKTDALKTLGLSTIRVDQTMRALAQNVPLLTKSLEGADTAFRENTELGRQYAMIQATLASKFAEFQNAIQNAAAAVGGALAPAMSELLSIATDTIVAFTQFASSPMGQTAIKMAAVVGVLVAAIAALIGVLALAKASMTVFSFALAGLGWTSTSAGFAGLIASLLSTNAATRASALSMTALKTAMVETGVGALAMRGAMMALNVAMGAIALTAVVAAFMDIDRQMNHSKYAAEALGASTEELSEAMKVDNASLFAAKVSETGKAAGGAVGGVHGLNDAVLGTVDAQISAAGAMGGTNKALDEQSVKIGAATKEWLKNAVMQSDAMKTILGKAGGGNEGNLVGAKTLKTALKGGFDLEEFTETAYKKGTGAANKVYDGWLSGLQKKAAGGNKAAKKTLDDMAGGFDIKNAFLAPIGEGIEASKMQALVSDAIMGVQNSTEGATPAVNSYGAALTDVNGAAVMLSDGQIGAVSSVEAYKSAISSAMGTFTSFSGVLNKMKEDATDKDGNVGPIDAGKMAGEMNKANDAAITFFNGIQTLAKSGKTQFATELAGVGPEAQGILSQALDMSGGDLGALEASARFAAFLASDAFTSAFESEMANSNAAYAKIFEGTGDLGQVQSYIAAQVAGTGAAWEAAWDTNHPDLKLNVDLLEPSAGQLAVIAAQTSGALTSAVKITPDFDGQHASEKLQVWTDTVTGNTITLPAALDGGALTATLALWKQNEGATPASINAAINKPGLSADLDSWKAAHANAVIRATVNVLNPPPTTYRANLIVTVQPYSTPGSSMLTNGALGRAKGGIIPGYAKGGTIDGLTAKRSLPAFASGGGYGKFRGPGTGTSDSILARVSAGEFINTKKATDFWGADFMDSLNRFTLPTSFLNMLGAASGAGSSGPTHQANVNVTMVNPVTRDPLKQLREQSEMVASGIWG
jgi:TP901 family phage tail tape measure protein